MPLVRVEEERPQRTHSCFGESWCGLGQFEMPADEATWSDLAFLWIATERDDFDRIEFHLSASTNRDVKLDLVSADPNTTVMAAVLKPWLENEMKQLSVLKQWTVRGKPTITERIEHLFHIQGYMTD
jgi:hypothetical protein